MTKTKSRRNAGTAAAILAIAIAAAGSHWQASTATAASTPEKVYKIGFHLWKPGKIYDEAMAGIRDGLKLNGIKYEEVLLQSKRDKKLAEENLKKLDTMGVDLIYSLSSAGTKIANRLGLAFNVTA